MSEKVSEEPEQRRSADGGAGLGGGSWATGAPSASQPQTEMNEATSTVSERACVRACVYTALKMQDGDLSGPVRSGTSVRAEECFTTIPDILESDPSQAKNN